MLLKKVLEIKKLVSKFNLIRNATNREPLRFSAHMFDLGDWSMEIVAPTDGCLYSVECSALFPLLSQLGCSFFIGGKDGNIRLFIQ